MRGPVILLAAGLLLGGCAAARRGGKDAVVVATWPVHAVTHPAKRISEVAEDSPEAAWIFSPFLIPFFVLEDAFFTGVAAGDLLLAPFYAPFPVEPLRLYDTRRMPPRLDGKAAEGFEEVCAGTVLMAAWIGALWALGRCGGPGPPPTEPGDPPSYYR